MPAAKKGLFITLEGPDGSGKSTQLRLLGDRLRHERIDFCLTREPGGGAKNGLAEKIRELLLSKDSKDITAEAELLLFLAARSQHVHEVILPALAAGKVVVCERFSDATLAYQVGGRGLPEKEVRAADAIATRGLRPNLTLLLDVPSQVGLGRAFDLKNGHDRMEAESAQFHRRVRQAYLRFARREPKRIVRIRSDRPVAGVHDMIWQKIAALLPRGRGQQHAL